MDKSLLIANLTAGRGRAKKLIAPVCHELDRIGISYELHCTPQALEATAMAQQGVAAGFSRIIALEGDGTINEVINGLIGSDVILGVIPAGMGNDFIRMNGIPRDPIQAVSLLRSSKMMTVDLGSFNWAGGSRYFVNGIGIGIDAQVAQNVRRMKWLRGIPAYLHASLKAVMTFRAFFAQVSGADWQEKRRYISLNIANGKYCGGGFNLAPLAKIDDGLIDLCAIGDFSIPERMIHLPRARKGEHINLVQVHYWQDKQITIDSPTPLIAYVDGEPLCLPAGKCTAHVVPRAIKILTCGGRQD
ncbi:diacylglycerol kinase family lipid kinase [Candidatus Bipolaricaulota bacterium]|nr:diacylglycerol kinase family lipid kinase [Candidatus Bipolaricaulota bacterium]